MLLLFFLSFFKQLNGFDQKIFFVSLSWKIVVSLTEAILQCGESYLFCYAQSFLSCLWMNNNYFAVWLALWSLFLTQCFKHFFEL
jgi:hypothetical protein